MALDFCVSTMAQSIILQPHIRPFPFELLSTEHLQFDTLDVFLAPNALSATIRIPECSYLPEKVQVVLKKSIVDNHGRNIDSFLYPSALIFVPKRKDWFTDPGPENFRTRYLDDENNESLTLWNQIDDTIFPNIQEDSPDRNANTNKHTRNTRTRSASDESMYSPP